MSNSTYNVNECKIKKYSEEINILIKTIPKEHQKTVRKIAEYYRIIGANDVLGIVKQLSEIDIDDVVSYLVTHDSNIDGG